MYDCSRKEGVIIIILECGYVSVCQRVDVSGTCCIPMLILKHQLHVLEFSQTNHFSQII